MRSHGIKERHEHKYKRNLKHRVSKRNRMHGHKRIIKHHISKKIEMQNDGSYKDTINIALAGNPNVGKSVIFNQLTGLSQTIGNWPGKTVERMEGHLDFLGYRRSRCYHKCY